MSSYARLSEPTLEPPEHVVISAAVAYASGLQPEDYGVLIRLLLQPGGWSSDFAAVLAEMQASGWAVSADRLRDSIGRLTEAGHVVESVRQGLEERRERLFTVTARPASSLGGLAERPPSQPTPSPARAKGWAYAIRECGSGLVKIGHSADPAARLKSLSTGSAVELELIWSMEGGAPLETHLHERFAARRIRGEWFDFSGTNPGALIQRMASKFGGDR